MAEQADQPGVCKNGHRQSVPNLKFCVFCGTALNRAQPQPNPTPAQLSNLQPSPQQPNSPYPQQPYPPQPYSQPQYPQPQSQSPYPPQQYQPPQYPPQPYPPPQYPQQTYPQQPYPPPNYSPYPPQLPSCRTCGGDGRGLPENKFICAECNWLRPLVPGYHIESSAFEWAADAKAMATLRSLTPLTAAAKKVSEKVGRRWIESTFNGILLGENQLPQIYAQAVKAARILGMTHMPDVYISGERAWDCLTFGTEKDSFIVIGSAIAGNFQGADMLFLLAREMGHCQAGHALWKSVIRFLIGEQSQAKGFMAGGIMNALKSPGQMIVNVVEVPLLAWARQAEITADRAGLLCVGNEEIARRVLISWSLRSSFLFKQINIKAWLEQQEASEEDGYSKLSELTTSSTPYLSRRLNLLNDYPPSPEYQYWRKLITDTIRQSAPPKPPAKALPASQPKALPAKAKAANAKAPSAVTNKGGKAADFFSLKCADCQTPMRVPLKMLSDKKELPVKCPNAECGKITRLKKSVKPVPKAKVSKPNKIMEETANYGE